MKKIVFILLAAFALSFFLTGMVWGGNYDRERTVMRFSIGDDTYVVNNEDFTMDTAPVIKEGRTMLPIKFVAEPLGADVTWDSDERRVTVELGETKIELWIEDNTAVVNGEYQDIDPDNPEVKPLIVPPGRTVLPLRFISETMGGKVDWCQNREEVTIHYPVNLEHQKQSVLVIEGMEEEITLNLQVSSLFPYAVYIDEERYQRDEKEGKERISPSVETEPEVFMSITHRENVDVAALVSEIEEHLKEKYPPHKVHNKGAVEDPLPSNYLYAVEGEYWNDILERYYLVEDFEGGAFIIKQKLFQEAEEGHGARFNGMLEDLFIWNPQLGGYVDPGDLDPLWEEDSTCCWDYQPTDMAPEAGWETADLEGLTREELVDVLGCPPHIIRMTSVVSADYNRELWVYLPYEDDSTGLYIWVKGDVFHYSKLDEFNGFWCHRMMDLDFWN